MIGILVTLGFGLITALVMHKKIMKKIELAPIMHKVRKFMVVLLGMAMILIIIYEKTIGLFDTWLVVIIINISEWAAFVIGMYYIDFLMNRGYLEQYVIVEAK